MSVGSRDRVSRVALDHLPEASCSAFGPSAQTSMCPPMIPTHAPRGHRIGVSTRAADITLRFSLVGSPLRWSVTCPLHDHERYMTLHDR